MESFAKKRVFIEIVFNEFRDRRFSFFDALGSVFCTFLSLENRIENRTIFVMRTDPDSWIWWVRSPLYLGFLKIKNIAY